MAQELFMQGLLISILGMGTVYLFLTLLIGAMNLSKIIFEKLDKYFPQEVEEPKFTNKKNADNEAEIALAIACAARERGKIC